MSEIGDHDLSIEKNHDEKPLLNFFELSDGQKENLTQKIASSNGVIRIFVHPFYEDYYNITVFDENNIDDKKRKDNVIEVLRRVAESGHNEKPPIFIFEEAGHYERDHLLEKLNNTIKSEIQDPLYIVPTIAGDPTPYEKTGDPQVDDNVPYEERWEKLIATYKQIGVKKAILGGMNLFIVKDQSESELKDNMYECVGKAAEKLSPHFDIQISSAAYPHNRSTLSTDTYK
jgi:hypothetical protein